jgi:hypothetical protein
MRRISPSSCAGAALVLALAASSCSGRSSPTTPQPSPTVTLPPVTRPTPPPVVVEQGCTAGHGVASAECSRTSSLFLPDLDAAIEQVALQHPELLDRQKQRSDGAYRILARDGYIAAVIDALGQRGLCAAVDMYRDFFLVKRGDEMSEEFLIEGPGDYVRRGPASYGASCAPAAFPLTPAEVVVKMFVGLYYLPCEPGVTPPHPDDKKLPLRCEGLVTATPKDKNLRTVPAFAHGPDVTWFVRNGEHRIEVFDYDQPFNKRVRPLFTGPFSLCATVLGNVTSCLNGEVVP